MANNALMETESFQMLVTVLEQAVDPRHQEIVASRLRTFLSELTAIHQEVVAERDAALEELTNIENALTDASYTDHPLVEQMWQEGIEEGFEAGQEYAMDTWYESGGLSDLMTEMLEMELRSVLAHDDYSGQPGKLAEALLDHRILLNDLNAQQLLEELLLKVKGEL